jgi:hypothetical protein
LAGTMLGAPAANAAVEADPRPVGAIQICKEVLGPGVIGAFDFFVRAGVPSLVSVEVGKCSERIPVLRDIVSVTELPKAGTIVRRFTVTPREWLIRSSV